MIALWISLAVAIAIVLGWRLRRATKILDGILREEHERTERQAATQEHRAGVPANGDDAGKSWGDFPT